MSEKVEGYLVSNINSSKGDLAESWKALHAHYTKKLWHQLTVEVRSMVNNATLIGKLNLQEFYEKFVSEFEHRINPLQLVEICLPISKFIYHKSRQEAYDFLDKLEKTVSKDKVALARLHTGKIELRLMHKDQNDQIVDIKAIRELIDSTQKEVENLVGVTEVHAPFYKVSALYLRELGDFAGYYREALRYLGVEETSKLTVKELHCEAVLVGFAALLGENVYNFGELLAHPILKSLDGTTEQWITEVLLAFNRGDLTKFYAMQPQWSGWDDLKKQKDFLVEKIRLLAIMELALARPAKSRNITFNEVAVKCQINVNEVELLVMKALSKGLIQGAIDQVEQMVQVTWVQPRVLDTNQILTMAARIASWKKDVTSMEKIVAEQAHEILTKN